MTKLDKVIAYMEKFKVKELDENTMHKIVVKCGCSRPVVYNAFKVVKMLRERAA